MHGPQNARILCIEDDPGAARLLQRKLNRAGYHVDVAHDGEDGLAAWETGSYEILTLDHDMPKITGIEIIRVLAGKGSLPPTVMITGAGNESIAVEAMKLGADDYIIKDSDARYLDLIPSVIEQALNKKRLLEDKRRAEEELRKFKTIAERASYGVAMSDLEGNLIYVNEAFAAMHGYQPHELLGRNLAVFHSEEQMTSVNRLKERLRREGSFEAEEVWHKRTDGSVFPTLMSASVIHDDAGRPLFLSATAMDISDHKRAEQALRESQRLLSVRDRISRVFLTIPAGEMYGEVLELILDALHSRLGLFGYLNEEGSLVWPSLTRNVWEICRVLDKAIVFPRERWGKSFTSVVDEKKTLCVNEPFTVPEGHVQVLRALGVPLIYRGDVIGVVIVANKDTNYEEDDCILLESIANHIAPVLHARLQGEREEVQRKLVEKALRESEHTLQTILRTSPVGISMAENRQIVWVNEAYKELFGFDCEEDFVGKDTRFLYPSEGEYDTVGRLYHELKDGSTKSIDAQFKRKDGSVFDAHLMLRAVDPSDPNTRVICALTDISWRKRAEQFIVQSERLKAIGELASGVAHSFNNLLQIVLGSSQVALSALERGDSRAIKTNLDHIVESTKVGAQTVKRLQDFARVRTNEASTEMRVFDLSRTAREAVEMSRLWWKTPPEKEGVFITMRTDLTPGCLVKANENELFEVVFNLIKNAAEALPRGGTITVQTHVEAAQAVLRVRDDGAGIQEEDQGKIFEPFWTTKTFEGAGMGLSTCYGIVNRHGGTISVQSEPGEGSVFLVAIPLAKKLSEGPEVAPDQEASFHLSILLVDDLRSVVELLGSGLEALGQTVMTATSGPEALHLFEEAKIDLVICDLGMPEMNGWQVGKALKQICEEKGIPKPPFVMLTGWGDQFGGHEKMADSGVDRILQKPLGLERLLEVIRELVHP